MVSYKQFLFVIFFFPACLLAQTIPVSFYKQPQKFLPDYIRDSLHLQVGVNFYKPVHQDSISEYMFYYVYSIHPSGNKSDGNYYRHFGSDSVRAKRYCDSVQAAGYEVMFYRTAGTSAARLCKRFFDYDWKSVSFILFHESIHNHKGRSGSRLPYVFEEALCDVMAHAYLRDLVQGTSDTASVQRYTRLHETIFMLINRVEVNQLSPADCKLQISILSEGEDLFFKDRYGYDLNKAFFYRYRSYCHYYFLLKECLQRFDDPSQFLNYTLTLKGTEAEVEKSLKKFLKLKKLPARYIKKTPGMHHSGK